MTEDEKRLKQQERESSPEYQALKDLTGDGFSVKNLVDGDSGDAGEVGEAGDAGDAGDAGGQGDAGDAGDAGKSGTIKNEQHPEPDKGKSEEDKEKGKQPPPGETDKNTFPLNEIFGDRFKSVDELKEADIAGQLEELETLRQENESLKGEVENPTLGFADDNVALYNEFVKETGVRDYNLFSKLNGLNMESSDNLDVMVMSQVLKNPRLAGKEPLLRKNLERQYKVDPQLVEDGDLDEEQLELNQLSLEDAAGDAKKSIAEIKEKLKLPEKREVSTPGSKKLSPEDRAKLEDGWGQVTKAIGDEWKSIPLTPEGAKEPIIDYVIDDKVKADLIQQSKAYAIENQMELNEDNMKAVFGMMQRDFVTANLPKIIHSVANKVSSMTKEEVDAIYTNPSALNYNQGGSGGSQEPDPIDDVFEKEKQQLG